MRSLPLHARAMRSEKNPFFRFWAGVFAALCIGFGAVALLGLAELSAESSLESEVEVAITFFVVGFGALLARDMLFPKNGYESKSGVYDPTAARSVSWFASGAGLLLIFAASRWFSQGSLSGTGLGFACAVALALLLGSFGLAKRKPWGWWLVWASLVATSLLSDLLFKRWADLNLKEAHASVFIGVGLLLGAMNNAREECGARKFQQVKWVALVPTTIGIGLLLRTPDGALLVMFLVIFLILLRDRSNAVVGLLAPFRFDRDRSR